MKKSLFAVLVPVALFAVTSLFGATASNEITLSGTGKCAKCSLGKTDKCQNALVVTKDGKEEVYFLKKNEVSDKIHKKICEEDKPMTVTGTVSEENGQKVITATKIEVGS